MTMKQQFAILFAIAIIIAGVSAIRSANRTTPAPEEASFSSTKDGPTACKAAIIKSLKDPSSASFGRVEASVSTQGHHFEIPVRAKNSFNAMVVSTFDCTITNSGVVMLREQQDVMR